MEAFKFEIVDGTEGETQEIEALLNQRNDEIGVVWSPKPITVVMQDSKGKLIGGLTGSTNFGWLHIRLLAVDTGLQGSGYGTKLMQMAEAEAVSRGCAFAHVDTFSFQALPFYQKLGYELFGTLDNYPFGHKRYYLMKRLPRAD